MKKILIIEDDTLVQRAYQDRLTQEGLAVDLAGTGQEGVQRAKTSPPDLVVLDLMLPAGMNGFDVLRELKSNPQLKTIPVLVLTNLDTEKTTALDMGAVDYLVKANVSIDEVVGKVKAHVS